MPSNDKSNVSNARSTSTRTDHFVRGVLQLLRAALLVIVAPLFCLTVATDLVPRIGVMLLNGAQITDGGSNLAALLCVYAMPHLAITLFLVAAACAVCVVLYRVSGKWVDVIYERFVDFKQKRDLRKLGVAIEEKV